MFSIHARVRKWRLACYLVSFVVSCYKLWAIHQRVCVGKVKVSKKIPWRQGAYGKFPRAEPAWCKALCHLALSFVHQALCGFLPGLTRFLDWPYPVSWPTHQFWVLVVRDRRPMRNSPTPWISATLRTDAATCTPSLTWPRRIGHLYNNSYRFTIDKNPFKGLGRRRSASKDGDFAEKAYLWQLTYGYHLHISTMRLYEQLNFNVT